MRSGLPRKTNERGGLGAGMMIQTQRTENDIEDGISNGFDKIDSATYRKVREKMEYLNVDRTI